MARLLIIMNWYYVESGQQRGPISEAELDSLFSNGTIRWDTLVWREGMAEWISYHQARPSNPVPPLADAPPSGGVVCSECGRIFPPDQVIRHGNANICATCKPVFLQKLREGVGRSTAGYAGPMEYAGFWIRFVAHFVDQIIVGIGSGVIGFVVGLLFAVGARNNPALMVVAQGISMLLGIGMAAVYYTWFVGKYGATPGKMILKLKVVRADGMPLSYGRSCGRYFSYIISSITCLIGYIMAGFDDEKRALHDRICDTRVIRVG